MSKLELLKPRVRQLAEQLLIECRRQKIDVIITQTLRTIEEQNQLYALGRTKPGKIVTNASGGSSLHNYGVAFDFCPVVGGQAQWNDLNLFAKVGAIGKLLGLEWGGEWLKFPDFPHFQSTMGYKLEDFMYKKVDWKKFELV